MTSRGRFRPEKAELYDGTGGEGLVREEGTAKGKLKVHLTMGFGRKKKNGQHFYPHRKKTQRGAGSRHRSGKGRGGGRINSG